MRREVFPISRALAPVHVNRNDFSFFTVWLSCCVPLENVLVGFVAVVNSTSLLVGYWVIVLVQGIECTNWVILYTSCYSV